MYFITALTNIVDFNTRFDSDEYKKHSSRCFGYFEDFDVAVEAVTNNWCDINETIYDYALIEKIDEGIHSIAHVVGFYKFDYDTDKYIEIPWKRTGFCNYSIG